MWMAPGRCPARHSSPSRTSTSVMGSRRRTMSSTSSSVRGSILALAAEAEALMNEVAALSDQIHLEVVDVSTRREEATQWGVTEVPTIAVGPGDDDAGVRFQGLPDGYEFTSFVETLASAGTENGHGLAPETLEALAALPADVEIKTFVTPT